MSVWAAAGGRRTAAATFPSSALQPARRKADIKGLKRSGYPSAGFVLVFGARGEDGRFADMSEPDGRRRRLLFHLQERGM